MLKAWVGVTQRKRHEVPFGTWLEQMVRTGFGGNKWQGGEAAGEEQEMARGTPGP